MITASKRVGSDKTAYNCPQCNVEDFFFNFVPKRCLMCGFAVGNLIALLEDISVRIYYYKNGEIN